MASLVTDILTNIKSVMATTLGGTYQEIPYVYDLSKNNDRTAELGYSARVLDGTPASGVNRVYTMDHRFELILTHSIVRGGSQDTNITTAITTMHNKADEIFKAMIHTKISLSSTVLDISVPTFSEPEIFERQKIVALRFQVTVKYRSALT